MKKRFPPDDEGDFEDKDNSNNYEALSVFCNRYVPATEETMSDMFSTKEIQKLVKDHVGVDMDVSEICELLIQMNYKYKLDDVNFMWMVRKES